MNSDTALEKPSIKRITSEFYYPRHYLQPWVSKEGTKVSIRPIRPDDEPMMVKFHESLSDQTVYLRYFYYMKLGKRTSHERLTRICSIDPKKEMVLVAEYAPFSYRLAKRSGIENKIVAVSRLNKYENSNDAEIAALVSDKYQGQGLGSEMLNRLFHIAHEANLEHVIAEILPQNTVMKRINEKLDFPVQHKIEDGVLKAIFTLNQPISKESRHRDAAFMFSSSLSPHA